jgi:hypothetical protein
LIKGIIHQEDITIVKICIKCQCAQFHKANILDIKAQINLLLPINRSSRQKVNKETSELNGATDQKDLTDSHIIFHPIITEYTFFSAVNGIFSKIDHILGHKVSLNKYKKIEITSCILLKHNRIKLEMDSKNIQIHENLTIHL